MAKEPSSSNKAPVAGRRARNGPDSAVRRNTAAGEIPPIETGAEPVEQAPAGEKTVRTTREGAASATTAAERGGGKAIAGKAGAAEVLEPPPARPENAPAPAVEEPAMANPAQPASPTNEPTPNLRGVSAGEGDLESTGAEPETSVPEEQAIPVEAAPATAESVHVVEPVPIEEPLPEERPATGMQHRPELFIVHISPEMAPVAKVGGLADVVFGLTRELAIRGNQVEIILPKYDNLRYDQIWDLTVAYSDLWVPWNEGAIHCSVYFGLVYDRKCFFIEPHSEDNFFNRGSIYGFEDDVLRYAFFSRAAMEFLWKANKHPDIIHCHDWQTALVPVFLYEIYQHLGMTHPRVCLTIHNFKHQGLTGMEVLRAGGLHLAEHFFDYNRLRDNSNPYALNLLKGGIVYSNFVTTVSPRYAVETKDQDQGFGLEPTLHTHQVKYGGVVNGIDYDVWNPEVDAQIPARYTVDSIEGKYENKRALRQRLMLSDNEKPIVAFIGRLDPQKGLDLVRHAIFNALERGAQFVLLGSSPDHAINADFWNLKQMLNDSPDCHLEIGFDENLAHLIYAGADMLLVPSRFEPCGLTQLIALRYGTIPVVRAVGGLADTIHDKDYSHRPLHERNGYVFEHYDNGALESALGRAISCYFDHPEHFRELMKNAMRCDYSWNLPGQDYLNIYDYIRRK